MQWCCTHFCILHFCRRVNSMYPVSRLARRRCHLSCKMSWLRIVRRALAQNATASNFGERWNNLRFKCNSLQYAYMQLVLTWLLPALRDLTLSVQSARFCRVIETDSESERCGKRWRWWQWCWWWRWRHGCWCRLLYCKVCGPSLSLLSWQPVFPRSTYAGTIRCKIAPPPF